jgi:hypothetical protein
MRHTAATAMAVALDVDAWAGAPVPADHEATATGWLRATGWQSVGAAPGKPISAVWQELGLTAGAAARTSGTAATGGAS